MDAAFYSKLRHGVADVYGKAQFSVINKIVIFLDFKWHFHLRPSDFCSLCEFHWLNLCCTATSKYPLYPYSIRVMLDTSQILLDTSSYILKIFTLFFDIFIPI